MGKAKYCYFPRLHCQRTFDVIFGVKLLPPALVTCLTPKEKLIPLFGLSPSKLPLEKKTYKIIYFCSEIFWQISNEFFQLIFGFPYLYLH